MRIHYTALVVMAVAGYAGWKTYMYFFDTAQPALMLHGLENGHYYGGEVQCTVASTKTGDISIAIDDQPLVNQFKISGNRAGHPFAIPTKTLSNGKHTLNVSLVDRTYCKNKASLECTFAVDNVPLQAAFVKPEAEYKVFQGRTLHVQFQVNKDVKEAKINALSHSFDCFPESKNSSVFEAYIPISCEENPSEYPFSIDVLDHVGSTLKLSNKFQVVAYPFKKQILHVSEEKIHEEERLGQDSKLFEERVGQLAKESPHEKLWHGTFCVPIDAERVTCDFGTIRTTQHKGRYAHKAIDLINAPRSVVWATQDGVVVLKERFANSGNTVVIDHGMGVLSMFFHLDDFSKLTIGDKIAQGNPVGTIGKTGHATGYHLHWEMRVNNTPVDPMQWTKPVF